MRRSLIALLFVASAFAQEKPTPILIAKPDAFKTLVNPNCSHCVDEAKRRKDELKDSDPVLCWTRGYSDGGAIPLRFFLNTYRVISDSYGVFVYDPDAGYSRGFAPSYDFEFHGWRNGVMVMRAKSDGTLFSCLSGVAFEGKRKGERLTPIPTLVSTWGEVMKRNPNAVAYHMFEKYTPSDLPVKAIDDSVNTRLAKVDPRLKPDEMVLGVRIGDKTKAYPLSGLMGGLTPVQELNGEEFVIISYADGPAAAYKPVAHQPRKWKGPNPDNSGVSPPDKGQPLPDGKEISAKKIEDFRDSKVGVLAADSTWRVDGRASEGELKGWTLQPIECVTCKWFAWSADYPDTELHGGKKAKPDEMNPPASGGKEKPIAGTAEFLRLLPKPFGVVKAVDAKARTVSLLLDDDKTAKEWPVEPDAEVWLNGFWGRLEQFKPDDRVWVWLKLDRKQQPVSVAMLADAVSAADIRNAKTPDEAAEPKRKEQRAYLRKQWESYGLPGMLTFQHVFSGELEVMLDHEAMRWGRSLKEGDAVELTADPPIKAVVKGVTPWRERTTLRLVVGELESSELKPGQRIGVKMTPPAKEVDESPYPPDLGRKRTADERVEWFLASMYCVCGVGKDTCTGHFYTLASCNPNGCGAPTATRDEVRKWIDAVKTDKEIWDALLKDRGPLMTRPHLKP